MSMDYAAAHGEPYDYSLRSLALSHGVSPSQNCPLIAILGHDRLQPAVFICAFLTATGPHELSPQRVIAVYGSIICIVNELTYFHSYRYDAANITRFFPSRGAERSGSSCAVRNFLRRRTRRCSETDITWDVER